MNSDKKRPDVNQSDVKNSDRNLPDMSPDAPSQLDWLGRMLRRFWWFDVVYPVTLSLLLLAALTFVIKSGQKQMRLSLLAEDRLIELSQSVAQMLPRKASGQNEARATIVSVTQADLQKFSTHRQTTSSNNVTFDVGMDTYAAVLKKIADKAQRRTVVYLRILPGLRELTPGDYDPLIDAMRATREKLDIRIVHNRRQAATLPEALRELAPLLDDEPCREYPEVQIRCSYSSDWNDWVIQSVVNDAQSDAPSTHGPQWISSQFATSGDSWILNLPPVENIPELSLKDVLSVGDPFVQGLPRVIMIGQTITSPNDPAAALSWVHLKKDSAVPLHTFWAQVSEMHASGMQILVPPPWLVNSVTIAFCLVVLAQLIWFDSAVALGSWIVFALLGPLVNGLAMYTAQIYVPLFDACYFGLATLVSAGFARLSFAAFERFRLDEKRRLHAWTSDLKSNFISLLSHNLNTPIAKMQGTLSLLSLQPTPGTWKTDVRHAEALVAQLELVVKAVLASTALEEGAVMPTPVTLERLAKDIVSQAQGPLRRLAVVLEHDPAQIDPDLMQLPQKIDVRSVISAVTCMAALFAPPPEQTDRPVSVRLWVGPANAESGEGCRIRLECDARWIPSTAHAILGSREAPGLRARVLGDFVADVLAGLVHQTARAGHGSMMATPLGRGGRIELLLHELAHKIVDEPGLFPPLPGFGRWHLPCSKKVPGGTCA
jgi:signal transduction histidine kinase